MLVDSLLPSFDYRADYNGIQYSHGQMVVVVVVVVVVLVFLKAPPLLPNHSHPSLLLAVKSLGKIDWPLDGYLRHLAKLRLSNEKLLGKP